ncbi:MAG: radical SAM protein, partial [Pyrinomonadaceae bacterium]|nr:radical SAM protein [Pyrinomonadaceae bacterium]
MKDFGEIDIELLKRFNQPGPRYTSYPTAPLFSSDFTAANYEAEIRETNADANSHDVSLYFHFPFCAKLCYFCGCNMLVTNDRSAIGKYNQYLKREVEMLAPLVSANRRVEQLHFGGGTPSYLTPEEIRDVGGFIKSKFNFSGELEASVEIDPRGLTREHLEAFREIGFNRTSFGVQDFNRKVQEAINRVQSEEITRQTVLWARELGYKSVNI